MNFRDLTFQKKIEYIKDYYKGPIIAALIIILVIIYFAHGYFKRDAFDAKIIYAGAEYFGAEYSEKLSSLALLGDDADRDGEKKIKLDQFSYTDIQGNEYKLTMTLTLKALIASGEPAMLWLDEDRLSLLLSDSTEYFIPASEWSTSSSADGYSVPLGESDVLKELGIQSDGLYMLLISPKTENSDLSENTAKIASEISK